MLRAASSSALGAAKPAPKVMPTVAKAYELQEEIGQGVSAKARTRRPHARAARPAPRSRTAL